MGHLQTHEKKNLGSRNLFCQSILSNVEKLAEFKSVITFQIRAKIGRYRQKTDLEWPTRIDARRQYRRLVIMPPPLIGGDIKR